MILFCVSFRFIFSIFKFCKVDRSGWACVGNHTATRTKQGSVGVILGTAGEQFWEERQSDEVKGRAGGEREGLV